MCVIPNSIKEKYEEFLRVERRLKPKSIKEYINYLSVLESEINDPLAVKHRSEIVDALTRVKTSRDWEDQTAWRCSFLIKKFYDWLTLDGIIPFNPYPFTAFRKPRPREVHFLTTEQFRSVVSGYMHLTHQDLLILWVLWDTALRREELRQIDRENVNLEERLIFLPADKSKGSYGQRYVTMSEETHALLTRQLDLLHKAGVGPHIFCGENYERINADEITKRIIRAGKVFGPGAYLKITPHMLRHSLATRMKEAGASDLDIMMTLGHSDIEMTRRYSHVTKTYARSVREKFLTA